MCALYADAVVCKEQMNNSPSHIEGSEKILQLDTAHRMDG
jgi:hypothetical protein